MNLAFFSFTFGGNIFVLIFLFLFFISAAFLFYKFTIPPVPKFKKILLTLIRSSALTLILLVLFEPVLSIIKNEKKNPSIAVLIDDTQSMNVSPLASRQLSFLKKYISENNFNIARGDVAVNYYTFTDKLLSYDEYPPDSISFSGELTDISNSLKMLNDNIRNENRQAVILITDGNYNTGKNPVYEAENLGIPVYTVGIGDTLEQKDVLVYKVVTNNIVYNETRNPVDVTLRWSGIKSETAEVTLADDGIVIDRQIISLTPGSGEKVLRFYFEPKNEGIKKLTASISNIQDELTVKNNYKTSYIKVLKSKLNILLIAGGPSPDVSVVAQSLIEEQHFKVSTLIQKNKNEFYSGKFRSEMLDSADCFVLIGFPTIRTNDELVRVINGAIEKQRKPILFIAGKFIDYSKLQNFEQYLPFNWLNPSDLELSIFASVAEKERNNPLVRLPEMESSGDEIGVWNNLPPVYKTRTIYRPKPESSILVNAKLQTMPSNEPIVLTRNINRFKSMAITGYGIWRWRLLTQYDNNSEKFLPLFLSNSVRWLTTKEDDKKVRVVTTKDIYSTVDIVEFTGQVYDEQYRPQNNAELKLRIFSEDEKTELTLNSVGNGRYEGQISGMKSGDYSFDATAMIDGKSAGEDNGKFAVGKINSEYFDTRINRELLEQIAYKTKAEYVGIENLGRLNSLLETQTFSAIEYSSVTEIEIWNWEIIAAIIILLLGVEWFIRKRSGMI